MGGVLAGGLFPLGFPSGSPPLLSGLGGGATLGKPTVDGRGMLSAFSRRISSASVGLSSSDLPPLSSALPLPFPFDASSASSWLPVFPAPLATAA